MLNSYKYMISSDPVKKVEIQNQLTDLNKQISHTRPGSKKQCALIEQRINLSKQLPEDIFNEDLFLKEIKEHIVKLTNDNAETAKKHAEDFKNNPVHFITWHSDDVVKCDLRHRMYFALTNIINNSDSFYKFKQLFEEYMETGREHLLKFSFSMSSSAFSNAITIAEHCFFKESFGTICSLSITNEFRWAIDSVTSHIEKGGKVVRN